MDDQTLRHLLDPTSAPLPQAWLWPALVIGALVTVAGLWFAARQLRAFGPPTGSLSHAAPLIPPVTALAALIVPEMLNAYMGRQDDPLTLGVTSLAITSVCLAVLASGQRARFLDVRPAQLLRTALLWLSMVPVLLACVFASVAAVMLAGGEVAPQPQVELLRSGDGALWYTGWYVLAGLAAPLREEFIFRLVVYGCLAAWLARGESWRDPGRVAAAVVSVTVFVAMHGTWAIGFAPLAVLGWVLTALYAHTGSLWPPVLLHALHNCLVITIYMAMGGAA